MGRVCLCALEENEAESIRYHKVFLQLSQSMQGGRSGKENLSHRSVLTDILEVQVPEMCFGDSSSGGALTNETDEMAIVALNSWSGDPFRYDCLHDAPALHVCTAILLCLLS